MEQSIGPKESWKTCLGLNDARTLVDYGSLIKWQEVKALKKILNYQEQCALIRHLIIRMTERRDDRLACEIIIESLLIFLAHGLEEELVITMFESLLQECDLDTIKQFVELALTSDVSDTTHDEQIFTAAIALVAEFGVAISAFYYDNPKQFPDAPQIVDHITTYLLSVSNNNSNHIRLSLLHFFGFTCSRNSDKTPFNRIMNRFGHTVIDHLFGLLFHKRSEAIALQFIMENLPYVLDGDNHTQTILHQTFKHYMLKKPERFSLFMQIFSDHLLAQPDNQLTAERRKTMLQHVGALFSLVSEVNNKQLAREFALVIQKFEDDSYQKTLITQIISEAKIRPIFKDLLQSITTANDQTKQAIIMPFRSTKRGRRPSFSKAQPMGTLNQVSFLGNIEAARVS